MKTGRPSQEETERNEQLYKDWESKEFTTVELINKYKISTARLYQIINRIKSKQNEN